MYDSPNRIREFRKARRMTLEELGDHMGLSASYLSRLERGELQADIRHIMKIAHFLGCRAADLLPWENAPGFREHAADDLVCGRLREVPVVSWVMAGKFAGGDPIDPSTIDKTIHIYAQSDDLFALRVSGDSMSLEAPSGSLIIVNPRDKDLIDGRLYVLQTSDHQATFKRYRCTQGPMRLEPCSHNPDHRTIYPQDTVYVIGRVIQIVREV